MDNTVRIHFTSSLLPAAALIRGLTFSTWHHCAIEVDGMVYESKLFGGVICRPLNEFASKLSRVKSVELFCDDKSACKEFLKSVLGQGYDWAAVVGIVSHNEFDIQHRWTCSELAGRVVRDYCGIDLPKSPARCTPRDILFATWSHRVKKEA